MGYFLFFFRRRKQDTFAQQGRSRYHPRHGRSDRPAQRLPPGVIKDTDDTVESWTVMMAHPVQGEIIAPIVGMPRPRPAPTITVSRMPITSWRQRYARPQLQYWWKHYYINRLFATVEMIRTFVEVGNVGVVVSYTGAMGADLSGKDYRARRTGVQRQPGCLNEPLLPGNTPSILMPGK